MVKVAPGYARNFLLPKRLAVAATDSNRKIVEQERHAHLRKEAKQKGEAEELARLMGAATVTIARKAGENDQLFGSVTANDIADALTVQKYNVERRKAFSWMNLSARWVSTRFRCGCIGKLRPT